MAERAFLPRDCSTQSECGDWFEPIVLIYDPWDRTREIARFPIARQIGGEHLCLPDYLRARDANEASDVIALQVVTIGRTPTERTDAFAEWTHKRIRAELGLSHAIAFTLLDAETAICTRLTDAFQIVPEQSTAALVIHHPKATYFNAAAMKEIS